MNSQPTILKQSISILLPPSITSVALPSNSTPVDELVEFIPTWQAKKTKKHKQSHKINKAKKPAKYPKQR